VPDIQQPSGSKSRAHVRKGLPRNLGELILFRREGKDRQGLRGGIEMNPGSSTMIASAREKCEGTGRNTQSTDGTRSEGNEAKGMTDEQS
jgi:hypothetical protein